MQITPIVAAVPKAVPMSSDIRQQRRNAASTAADGWMSDEDQLTIAAIVPEARHAAASAPATTKRASMEATERMDNAPARSSSGRRTPRRMP